MIRFSPRPNSAHSIKWREWSEEAFAEARALNRPLAVFITAFWCGVCQRLDETSLSRDEVIALLNAFFVPVRLEESQRPDVDVRYNQNGWPTIVFLGQGGEQLASVNYMEPGQFIGLLTRVVDYWQTNGATLNEAEDDAGTPPEVAAIEATPPSTSVVAEIAGMLEGLADPVHGGFGTEHKYLHTEANDFLLYLHCLTGERAYLDIVSLTLDKLRASRTFDAQNGGFFRYSSRRDWQEPHPEKLLLDQACLLRNFLGLYLLTDEQRHRDVAEGLITYLDTRLSSSTEGPFLGCEDHVRQIAERGATGPPPLLAIFDELIYTDANAAVVSAYLDAWSLLGIVECRRRAEALLDWLWIHLRAPGGGMYHFWDGQPNMPGMLLDSLAMGGALLDAYATLGGDAHLERAVELAKHVLNTHRNERGGFYDINYTGPANLRFPLTMLTQNATAASFFVRLADLCGEASWREQAAWALSYFANSHREHGAYAAGFGHAVARYLSAPLVATVGGTPGPAGRDLIRAALTQLRHPNLLFRHVDTPGDDATLELDMNERHIGPFTDASQITPNLLHSAAHPPAT